MSLNINLIVTPSTGRLYDVLHETPKRHRAEYIRTQAALGIRFRPPQYSENETNGKDDVITAKTEALIRIRLSVTPSSGELYRALLEMPKRQRAKYIRTQATVGIHLRQLPQYFDSETKGKDADDVMQMGKDRMDSLKINLVVPSDHELYGVLREMPKRQRAEYIRTQSVLGVRLRQRPQEIQAIPSGTDNEPPIRQTDSNDVLTADEFSLDAFDFSA